MMQQQAATNSTRVPSRRVRSLPLAWAAGVVLSLISHALAARLLAAAPEAMQNTAAGLPAGQATDAVARLAGNAAPGTTQETTTYNVTVAPGDPPAPAGVAAPLLWDATDTMVDASVKATVDAAMDAVAAATGNKAMPSQPEPDDGARRARQLQEAERHSKHHNKPLKEAKKVWAHHPKVIRPGGPVASWHETHAHQLSAEAPHPAAGGGGSAGRSLSSLEVNTGPQVNGGSDVSIEPAGGAAQGGTGPLDTANIINPAAGPAGGGQTVPQFSSDANDGTMAMVSGGQDSYASTDSSDLQRIMAMDGYPPTSQQGYTTFPPDESQITPVYVDQSGNQYPETYPDSSDVTQPDNAYYTASQQQPWQLPDVQAATGPLLAAKLQAFQPQANPPTIVLQPVPNPVPAPPQLAAAAAPSTPTVLGSGGIKVVTSNPISLSNPIDITNPNVNGIKNLALG